MSIPRTTHVYLVENYFCSKFTSLKKQIYSRYSNFLRKLIASPSYEVNILSKIFLRDARSITCQNFSFLSELASVNIIDTPVVELKSLLQNDEPPANDQWRTGLLDIFIHARNNSDYRTEMSLSQHYVSTMIDSLCSS